MCVLIFKEITWEGNSVLLSRSASVQLGGHAVSHNMGWEKHQEQSPGTRVQESCLTAAEEVTTFQAALSDCVLTPTVCWWPNDGLQVMRWGVVNHHLAVTPWLSLTSLCLCVKQQGSFCFCCAPDLPLHLSSKTSRNATRGRKWLQGLFAA